MFKFDFYSTEDASNATSNAKPKPTTASDPNHLARRMEPSHDVGPMMASGVEEQLTWQSGDVTLVRAVPKADACPGSLESDLVPGVYEGGLKVWEASIDLVEYLASLGVRNRTLSQAINSVRTEPSLRGEVGCSPKGKEWGYGRRVLELGCGHGFPGIMALRQGMHVCFSDFNSEVIEQTTVLNVRLNVPQECWDNAEYYCGDWGSLSPLLEQRSEGGLFDLILTAETLYTTAVSEKVLAMILRHLSVGGHALVASKRFYFGTGGSTQHFRGLVEADGRLLVENASVLDTGKGNIREILRLSWKEGGDSNGAR